MAEGSEKMMGDLPLIAYPPIKRIIKLEIPDESQEVNNVEEENWTRQVYSIKLIPINNLYSENCY